MQKFYVQSGHAKWLVMAEGHIAAATRFMQLVMNESFNSGKQPTATYKLVDKARAQQLVSKLAAKISIGTKGFDSLPKVLFDTNELLQKWHRQTCSLEQIIRKCR